MTKFQIGDLVRIKGREQVYRIVEVDVPGCEPLPPSTYTVRMAVLPDLKPDFLLYGDAVLERAPN